MGLRCVVGLTEACAKGKGVTGGGARKSNWKQSFDVAPVVLLLPDLVVVAGSMAELLDPALGASLAAVLEGPPNKSQIDMD